MTFTIELDIEGKLAVPDAMREAHGLRAGSQITLDDASGCITLRPLPLSEDVPRGLRLERGFLVVDNDTPLTVEDVRRQIEADRSAREDRI